MSTALDRLAELWSRLDDFSARAKAAHGDAITCHAGCDACCHRRFSVTAIESAALRRHLDALDPEAREALRDRALHGDPTRCPALDADGRCDVYAARPVICRSHGLALRFRDDARHLPVLDACERNYTAVDLATRDPGTVLDQTTLSTIVAALDAAHTDAVGLSRGHRDEISTLLADVTAVEATGHNKPSA